MKSQTDATKTKVYQVAIRVKLFIIQNLLTLLFLFIFSTQFLSVYAVNRQIQTSKTNYSPVPNAILFLNFSSVVVPTIVATERVVTSKVTVAERRQHLAWYAESFTNRGIRYRSGSASVENGFDCSGLVHYIMGYFDITIKRSSSDMYKEGIAIPVESAQAGDLVFFGSKNTVSHVAMVVSNDEKGLVVIHSCCSQGVKKENVTESKYWKPLLKEKAVNVIGF